MKRDMELIRKLMLTLEDDQSEDPDGYDNETIAYHKALLIESGMAHGIVDQTSESLLASTFRLTWNGHEFLDVAHNETGWRSVMKRVATTVGTTSLPVLQALLVEYAKSTLQGTRQP